MTQQTGIDAIGFYIPSLVVSMKDLAEARNIPFEKLNLGLGLSAMSIPDADEDAGSFAANALLHLIENNQVDPKTIGRIYLGTESAVDGSKPTATYAVGAVEQLLASKYGTRSFKNCDVVDMTFACVGAVDAFHNCVDWVRGDASRKAIVIASDVSKYELNSTGEYTQGAGAVAVLITQNPSIITIDDCWGVGMESVNDFFKPRREVSRLDIISDLKDVLNLSDSIENIDHTLLQSSSEFWQERKSRIELFKEEPVFEGQYSNQCYENRVSEALAHFTAQKTTNFIDEWHHLIFHLPYAFHGRRIIFNNWLKWIENTDFQKDLVLEIGELRPSHETDWNKAARKSKVYKTFVQDRIAPSEQASSEIGNMYTASIFMALVSLLSNGIAQSKDLSGNMIGFIAYGSGSKSKVFQGTIQPTWADNVASLGLFETLEKRQKTSVMDYELLHNLKINSPLTRGGVRLRSIDAAGDFKGYRNYR